MRSIALLESALVTLYCWVWLLIVWLLGGQLVPRTIHRPTRLAATARQWGLLGQVRRRVFVVRLQVVVMTL
jgi:hypothetical protein